MRRISSLCRKLNRRSQFLHEVHGSRGHWFYGCYRLPCWHEVDSRQFSTVRECEQFLVSLFR